MKKNKEIKHHFPYITMKTIRHFIESGPIKALRIAALSACIIWLMAPLVLTVIQAQGNSRRVPDDSLSRQYLQDIQNEHRFSVLETKISAIDDRTSSIQNTMWGLIIGMTGLLGERGISIIRQRKPKGDENETQN